MSYFRESRFTSRQKSVGPCEDKKIQGFLSASSVTDLFYLIRRATHSVEIAYRGLGAVLDIAKVLTVTNGDVLTAFLRKAADFEDCLLAVCAKSNRCDAIVTRNKKDFQSFQLVEKRSLFSGLFLVISPHMQ